MTDKDTTAAPTPQGVDLKPVIDLLKSQFVSETFALDNGKTAVIYSAGMNLKEFDALNPILPEHVKAGEKLVEPASLVEYVNRFKTADTVAKASLSGNNITVVLDYHAASPFGETGDVNGHAAPRPGSHIVALQTDYDPDWKRWAEVFGAPMSQEKYGRFIEDMAHTIGRPALADLLAVVTQVDIERQVKLKSRINAQSGAIQLTYEEIDSSGTSGAAQSVSIPSEIVLVLPVFAGTAPIQVSAKLRFSLERGHIVFTVDVPGVEKIIRDQFRAIGEDVRAKCTVPVFYTA